MVIDPSKATVETTFEMVANLRATIDYTKEAQALCKNNVNLFEALGDTRLSGHFGPRYLLTLTAVVQGHLESANALIARIQNALDLSGYALTVHNQLETESLDRQLVRMTANLQNVTEKLSEVAVQSAQDAGRINAITYVSAIYLPGSFVGTLFGMNFFMFNDATNRIRIATDSWVFLMIWLGFIIATVGAYGWIRKRHERKEVQRKANRAGSESGSIELKVWC